jgi:hypothetical protein
MQIPCEKLVGVPALLDHDGLLAAWRRLVTGAEFGQQDRCELDERAQVVVNLRPSARRQIVLTDVYCHVTEQMGHLAAMSAPVTTHSFGIRVPTLSGCLATSGKDSTATNPCRSCPTFV